MNWKRIKAIIGKDLREVLVNKMVVMPMVLVPVILCIVMPAGLLLGLALADVNLLSGGDLLKKVIPLYAVPGMFTTDTAKIIYIMFNYTFLPFLMIIPVMVSSIIASNGIVGEKERKTLETLLYTPVTNREFLTAKLLSALLPAVAVSFISFIGYFAVTNILYGALKHALLVRSLIWLPAVLVLNPAVSMLGLSITLMVSLKAKTYMEAQQMSGIVVLPLLVLIFIQLTGVIVFKPLYVLVLSAVFGGTAYAIFSKIGPRFDRERIISTL